VGHRLMAHLCPWPRQAPVGLLLRSLTCCCWAAMRLLAAVIKTIAAPPHSCNSAVHRLHHHQWTSAPHRTAPNQGGGVMEMSGEHVQEVRRRRAGGSWREMRGTRHRHTVCKFTRRADSGYFHPTPIVHQQHQHVVHRPPPRHLPLHAELKQSSSLKYSIVCESQQRV
jgi:hypothetical protein